MDSHYYISSTIPRSAPPRRGSRGKSHSLTHKDGCRYCPKWRALPGEITVVIQCTQCSLCSHGPMGKSENNRECNDTTNGLFTAHGAPQGRKNDIWERANRFLNGKSTILQWEIDDSIGQIPKISPLRGWKGTRTSPPGSSGDPPGRCPAVGC